MSTESQRAWKCVRAFSSYTCLVKYDISLQHLSTWSDAPSPVKPCLTLSPFWHPLSRWTEFSYPHFHLSYHSSHPAHHSFKASLSQSPGPPLLLHWSSFDMPLSGRSSSTKLSLLQGKATREVPIQPETLSLPGTAWYLDDGAVLLTTLLQPSGVKINLRKGVPFSFDHFSHRVQSPSWHTVAGTKTAGWSRHGNESLSIGWRRKVVRWGREMLRVPLPCREHQGVRKEHSQ